jgi:hypothetical protein
MYEYTTRCLCPFLDKIPKNVRKKNGGSAKHERKTNKEKPKSPLYTNGFE